METQKKIKEVLIGRAALALPDKKAASTFLKVCKKMRESGCKYGVFYANGYCDLFTNERGEAIDSYWFLPENKRGWLLEIE